MNTKFYCTPKDSDLMHYGIKGMKWGVRHDYVPVGRNRIGGYPTQIPQRRSRIFGGHSNNRSTPMERKEKGIKAVEKLQKRSSGNSNSNDQSRKLSKKQKQILIAGAAVIGVSAAAYLAYKYGAVNKIKTLIDSKRYTPEQLESMMIEELKNTSLTLPKGTEIHRSVNDLSSKSLSGSQYATYLKDDYVTYRSLFGHNVKNNYDVVFKATEEIKAPSFNEANNIFNKFIAENPSYKNELRESLIKTRMNYFLDPVSYEKAAMEIDSEMNDSLFKSAVHGLVNRDSKTTKQLINLYQQKGYNAIEDYVDKGVRTQSPLYIFDMDKSTTQVGKTLMTDYLKELDGIPIDQNTYIYDFFRH